MSPADNDFLTCEDCEEESEEVAICTAPVFGWQDEPPDQAALCTRCHDRRLNPRDYYDGPETYFEAGREGD